MELFEAVTTLVFQAAVETLFGPALFKCVPGGAQQLQRTFLQFDHNFEVSAACRCGAGRLSVVTFGCKLRLLQFGGAARMPYPLWAGFTCGQHARHMCISCPGWGHSLAHKPSMSQPTLPCQQYHLSGGHALLIHPCLHDPTPLAASPSQSINCHVRQLGASPVPHLLQPTFVKSRAQLLVWLRDLQHSPGFSDTTMGQLAGR